jgi:hypothetical protein
MDRNGDILSRSPSKEDFFSQMLIGLPTDSLFLADMPHVLPFLEKLAKAIKPTSV